MTPACGDQHSTQWWLGAYRHSSTWDWHTTVQEIRPPQVPDVHPRRGYARTQHEHLGRALGDLSSQGGADAGGGDHAHPEGFLYANPRSKLETIKDVMGIAIEGVLDIVVQIRNCENVDSGGPIMEEPLNLFASTESRFRSVQAD